MIGDIYREKKQVGKSKKEWGRGTGFKKMEEKKCM